MSNGSEVPRREHERLRSRCENNDIGSELEEGMHVVRSAAEKERPRCVIAVSCELVDSDERVSDGEPTASQAFVDFFPSSHCDERLCMYIRRQRQANGCPSFSAQSTIRSAGFRSLLSLPTLCLV
uniref:Uncharacterized protein n=1 Tax=Calcidiscus leptoporus TaxID=127549 RepID=A0A7S0P0M6_9EUKA